jgi:predicted transcriptional regulator
MQTAKKEINKLLRRLPEDCSMEDIQYHIYVLQKIERGLQQADQGMVISAEAVEKRMKKWLGR